MTMTCRASWCIVWSGPDSRPSRVLSLVRMEECEWRAKCRSATTGILFVCTCTSAKGKVVLSGRPRLSCRSVMQIGEFGMPSTIEAPNLEQNQLLATYRRLNQRVPTFYQDANEYVMLSAHYDSWEGHSGATDNGTGSVTMLEALRILKTVYPQPKRTIIIGLWSGEEQGLNGSGAYSADHPEVIQGLQFLFNQDNGTGRVVRMSPGILPKNGERLAQYMSSMPAEITQWVRLGPPGGIGGGTDHVSFACRGAPALTLNALSWDYSNTMWHTQRDSYDKLIIDDVKNNATLTAMLAYMASEDPERSSRELLNPMPNGPGGQPMTIPSCGAPTRSSQGNRR